MIPYYKIKDEVAFSDIKGKKVQIYSEDKVFGFVIVTYVDEYNTVQKYLFNRNDLELWVDKPTTCITLELAKELADNQQRMETLSKYYQSEYFPEQYAPIYAQALSHLRLERKDILEMCIPSTEDTSDDN